MAKTARAVQVPGEPTQELPATEPTQELPAGAEGEAGQPLVDEVAALRAQLEAERLARIEAEQRAAAVAAESAPKRAAPAAVVKTSAGHPTPQLTEGGWVVPQSFGAPAVKG